MARISQRARRSNVQRPGVVSATSWASAQMASPAQSAIIMKLASTGPNSSDIAAEIVTIRNAKTSKTAHKAPMAFNEKLGSDFLANKESDAINAVVAKNTHFNFITI